MLKGVPLSLLVSDFTKLVDNGEFCSQRSIQVCVIDFMILRNSDKFKSSTAFQETQVWYVRSLILMLQACLGLSKCLVCSNIIHKHRSIGSTFNLAIEQKITKLETANIFGAHAQRH